jgi:hypothetical protein
MHSRFKELKSTFYLIDRKDQPGFMLKDFLIERNSWLTKDNLLIEMLELEQDSSLGLGGGTSIT